MKRKDRPFLTPIELARRWGLGKDQIYEAVKTGQIPSIEIGNRRLISTAVADRMQKGETLNS